ncbi:hypothetical protein Leryth_027241 [Lithospermum erythrorhizon]|nr:hypothetical protein Leryth_027241 [Lithospermum erythrorhizon]
MDGPNKGPSPKKGFSGHKLSNSGSRGSNENYDCSAEQTQNHKKPITKHFMSPTISAASKVAVPRNKILGERNGIEAFSDTRLQKSPNFAPRNDISGHYSSPKIISSNNVVLEANDVDDKSAMNAYDPSSCDPSPRPKYLRYNPNRRHEFFLQFENEGGEESDSQNDLDEEVSSVDDEISPSVGGSLDSENVTSLGVVKKQDYKAEVEENGEDEVVEEFEEEAEQYEKDASHGVVNEKNYEDEVDLNDEEVQEEFEEEEAELYEEVRGWSLKGIMKFLVVLSIFVLATSFIFSMDSTVLNSEEVTVVSTKDGYNRNHEQTSKDAALYMLKEGYETYMGVLNMDFEDVKPVEDSEEGMMENGHEQVEFVDMPVEWEDERPEQYSDQLNMATSANSNHGDMETEVEWNEDQPLEDEWHTLSNQLIGSGFAESVNSINGGEMETEVKHNLDLQPLEDECRQFSDQQIEADKAESADQQIEADKAKSADPRDDGLELPGRKEQTGLPEDYGPLDKDDMVESKDMLEDATIETIAASETRLLQLKNKATGIGIIGVLLSIISGSLFFISRSKGKKASEGPNLVVSKIIPIEKLVLTEETCPVTPKVEEQKIGKLAEPCAASALDFSEQAAKEFTQISAPTVQLLGELVVREVERSLRRCDRDQKGSELIESEDSNNIQERKKKAARFQISPAITPALEFSTTDSPSCYGSFTTEAKILKKENGRDAELTTPVRRSSRIRSRTVTSS